MTKPIAHIFIAVIKAYQRLISPFLGSNCRFYPSCSQYAILSLKLDPTFVAMFKISKRLLKCSPLHPGGVDLP